MDDVDSPQADDVYPAKMVKREGRRHTFFGTILNADETGGVASVSNTQSPSQPPRRIHLAPINAIPASPFSNTPSAGYIEEAELGVLFDMVNLLDHPSQPHPPLPSSLSASTPSSTSEGWKRVEVVQAFACMTYWKEPGDTACTPASEPGATDLT